MNSTNASSTTSISPHLLWYNSTKSIILFINPILNIVISTSCLITLNTYMKKLHKTFKTLLNMVLIHNILAEILLVSLNVYMLATHTQNLITCSIRQLFTGLQTYLTVYCIAVMSFLRYHIARKINNQESTQNVFGCMIGVTIWYGLFELFNSAPLPFLLTIFFEIPFKGTICAGVSLDSFPIMPVYNILKVLFLVCFGIRYDFKMMKFLKKKNTHPERGQAKLVPWKSGGQTYDFVVPTSATVTSALTGMCALIIGLILIKSISDGYFESWKTTEILMNTIASVQMPILIGLTIRAAKHKKVAPAIPKGPMFHDEDDDLNQDQHNNQIEMSVSHVVENNDVNHVSVSSN